MVIIVVSLTSAAYLYAAICILCNKIKDILAKAKPELQKKYPLSELGIFGGYVRGDATEESDIDVLVDFNEPLGLIKYIGLSHKIQGLFNLKVDVISRDGIKNQNTGCRFQAFNLCLKECGRKI